MNGWHTNVLDMQYNAIQCIMKHFRFKIKSMLKYNLDWSKYMRNLEKCEKQQKLNFQNDQKW